MGRTRDLALFNLAIDSKLLACDLVKIRVRDVNQAGQIVNRVIIMQRKTKRPVQFEIMDQARLAVGHWISLKNLDLPANEEPPSGPVVTWSLES